MSVFKFVSVFCSLCTVLVCCCSVCLILLSCLLAFLFASIIHTCFRACLLACSFAFLFGHFCLITYSLVLARLIASCLLAVSLFTFQSFSCLSWISAYVRSRICLYQYLCNACFCYLAPSILSSSFLSAGLFQFALCSVRFFSFDARARAVKKRRENANTQEARGTLTFKYSKSLNFTDVFALYNSDVKFMDG